MAKKANPELIAKIDALHAELRKLSQQVQDSESDGIRAPREPIDDAELDRVRTMLQNRPMTFAEIVEAADLPENRIKALLTKMQRDEELLINIGQQNAGLWYHIDRKAAARVLKRLTELGVAD